MIASDLRFFFLANGTYLQSLFTLINLLVLSFKGLAFVYRRFFFAIFSMFTLGCTATLEDFYGMSKFKRADLVCSHSKIARERKSKIEELSYEVRETKLRVDKKKELLDIGYRVHRHCRQVPVQSDTNCEVKDDCKVYSYTRVCEETPVPIDYQYEEKKLNQLENNLASTNYSLTEAEINWEFSYAKCSDKVRALSVQESFSYYESGREPP